ncbi:MAG: 16S rRNA (adenine(1518)-N(6)/adenine(1519)-N(6))-dimethyltransferase RsmA [Thermoanaerobaculia bacterium]
MAHRPQKKWGQNFLRNRGAVEQIVAALEAPPAALVLEIGPGKGALTEILAGMPVEVRAWEIDPALAAALSEKFADTPVEIVEADATEAELPDRPFWAVGNLPYNVATPIVRRVIASPHWRRAVFMFQKEVGDKLTASPGDPDYGFLTLVVGLRAEVKRLIQLSPGSFFPRPKVHSTVVRLDPIQRDLRSSIPEVESLVSVSFRMRRKTLLNNLIGYREMTREEATEAIEAAGLDPRQRAETIHLDEFDGLAAIIARRSGPATSQPA